MKNSQTLLHFEGFIFTAIGFSSGRVMVVDGLVLSDCGENDTKSDFYHCHDSITKIAFSDDCQFMACSVSCFSIVHLHFLKLCF